MKNSYLLSDHQNTNKAAEDKLEVDEPYESRHEKTCLCHMRTTKAQISLRIRAVSSAP